MNASFQHRYAAHCESGVMAALASHAGQPVSEAMAFGLASALAFAYLPLVRIGGQPLIAYRMPPKFIVKGLRTPLGLDMRFESFRSAEHGMARLDALLDDGHLVGLQTSVYWLPYFPEALRFHFNAHNLIVYGREGDDYLISDPVFEAPVRCARAALEKARFVRGPLAPNGLLYHCAQASEGPPDWAHVIPRAIRKTCRIMGSWLPYVGVRGMRQLARVLRAQEGADPHRARLFIGHVVRMQEEVGTGGAGFRFMYAAFLQEAATRLQQPALAERSNALMDIGDLWREFALAAARMCRGKSPLEPARLATQLEELAQREQDFFRELQRVL